jgi:predicted ATP-binding protein involved in virulence
MTAPNTLLRIDRMEVQNFRCFAYCPLDLHPELTILVAENGGGKTALLDALRLALSVFVTSVARSRLARGFEPGDIRRIWDPNSSESRVQSPTSFKVSAIVDTEPISWSRDTWSATRRTKSSTRDLGEVIHAGELISARLEPRVADEKRPAMLPVVAYYGTGRLWDQHRLTRTRKWIAAETPARFSAYLDCLSPSASYKAFTAWYEEMMRQVSDSAHRTLGFQARPENAVVAVRQAVKTVLQPTGWTTLDWQFPDEDDEGRTYGTGFLVVEHESKLRLPLDRLSDGIRNMVALVADIAHRCVRLNPHLGEAAASETPGVLLIDEIDMHLHPSWQQLVIGLLQKAFPTVQIIATTHSPHVLSTVDAKCIRVVHLDEGQGKTPKPSMQTEGDASAAVLASVMNVDPVPEVESSRWASDYRAMVQGGDYESGDARVLWHSLVTHFGEDHHIVRDLEVLRRLQEFKAEHRLS